MMEPLKCGLQHLLTSPHVSMHMAAEHDDNHAAITLRSATTDSKTPYNYAHMNASKAARSYGYTVAKNQRQNARKITMFRAPAASPTDVPCNIHAAITMRCATSRGKIACMNAHGSGTWQQSCCHRAAICNHRFQNIR